MNIKQLAEQAGMHYRELCDEFAAANTDGVPFEMMERFAELVAEDRENLHRACVDALVFIMDNGTHCSLDIEHILKQALGDSWRNYK